MAAAGAGISAFNEMSSVIAAAMMPIAKSRRKLTSNAKLLAIEKLGKQFEMVLFTRKMAMLRTSSKDAEG